MQNVFYLELWHLRKDSTVMLMLSCFLTDKKTRPVVLIAPLADALIQKLSSESPDKYFYCEPGRIHSSLTLNCLLLNNNCDLILIYYIYIYNLQGNFNEFLLTFPPADTFWSKSSRRHLKTLWPKVKLLMMNNFSFGHNVFNFI